MAKLNINTLIDQRKLLPHILFCLVSVAAVTFVSLKTEGKISISDMVAFFILLLIQIEVFIFIASRIFKEMSVGLTRKEFTKIVLSRFILFIVICFFAALLIFLAFRYIGTLIQRQDLSVVLKNFRLYEMDNWFRSTIKGLLIGAIIFIIIQWQDALRREQKLREENLIFQNETLKTQVNPHFLFNNLNTLSSLIKSEPESADAFTSRLASIYRYILENSPNDRVPLGKELTFIDDYFYLHRVRDENKIEMEVTVSNIDKFLIMPVSLQVLVENAIKHNMATRENPLRISVFIEDNYIVVRNNLQKMAGSLKSTKIGLKNLDERVKIITGKNLIIDQNNNFFTVKVPLIL